MSRPLRMGTAAAVVSGSVLLSRLLGLGREALLAGLFGTTTDGDLYRWAFTLPDFLNYLLAGAFLTITLIPILSRHVEKGDAKAADQAFTSVFRFVAVAILVLTALMWLFADQLVNVAFPRVVAEHDRLVAMTRLVLPAQVFFVVGALLMAVQYTHKRFVIPALAPIVYNMSIIGGGLIGAALSEATPEAFLWGALVGSAIGNFGIQLFGAKRSGTWFTPAKGESSVREYLVLALPLMLAQSIAVLDEQFVRFFGQVEEGATSALTLARQLNMVPVGVIAQAAGVAAFPFLAGLAARGDTKQLVETTGRAARNTLFIATAASAALIVVAGPLVRVLYQYGAFSSQDSELVSRLLMIYAFSIPAWGLQAILSRHFYAKRKMWTPVIIGTAFTLVAIPAWLYGYDTQGVEGFALASSLVVTAYAVGLLLAWGVDSGWDAVRGTLPTIGRGVLAAGAAVAVAYPLVQGVFGDSQDLTLGSGLAAGAVGGLTALAVFVGAALLLKAPELNELKRR
jgi:putative peptidoglycan lipid II flippase